MLRKNVNTEQLLYCNSKADQELQIGDKHPPEYLRSSANRNASRLSSFYL